MFHCRPVPVIWFGSSTDFSEIRNVTSYSECKVNVVHCFFTKNPFVIFCNYFSCLSPLNNMLFPLFSAGDFYFETFSGIECARLSALHFVLLIKFMRVYEWTKYLVVNDAGAL